MSIANSKITDHAHETEWHVVVIKRIAFHLIDVVDVITHFFLQDVDVSRLHKLTRPSEHINGRLLAVTLQRLDDILRVEGAFR